ncbi:MAG: hypothetical protein R3C99_08505 [Pirellulaceae bacterium]
MISCKIASDSRPGCCGAGSQADMPGGDQRRSDGISVYSACSCGQFSLPGLLMHGQPHLTVRAAPGFHRASAGRSSLTAFQMPPAIFQAVDTPPPELSV